METLKNILTGFVVVFVVGLVGFTVLQGFGLLYEHIFPMELFSFSLAPEWGGGNSPWEVALDIGVTRFLWGIVTVVGLLLVVGTLLFLHKIGDWFRSIH